MTNLRCNHSPYHKNSSLSLSLRAIPEMIISVNDVPAHKIDWGYTDRVCKFCGLTEKQIKQVKKCWTPKLCIKHEPCKVCENIIHAGETIAKIDNNIVHGKCYHKGVKKNE